MISNFANKNLIQKEKKIIINKFSNNIIFHTPTQSMGEVCAASNALDLAVGIWMLNKYRLPNLLIIGRDYNAIQYSAIIISSVNNVELGQ